MIINLFHSIKHFNGNNNLSAQQKSTFILIFWRESLENRWIDPFFLLTWHFWANAANSQGLLRNIYQKTFWIESSTRQMIVNSKCCTSQHWMKGWREGAKQEGGLLPPLCQSTVHHQSQMSHHFSRYLLRNWKRMNDCLSPFGKRNRQKGAGPKVPSTATINTLQQSHFLRKWKHHPENSK